MKKSTNQILLPLFVMLLALALVSCNNDFLKSKQEIEVQLPDTIFMTDLEQEISVNFAVPDAKNKHWRIQQLPPWLTIVPIEGDFTNGSSSFQLQLPDKYAIRQWGYFDLPLIFEIEGIGLVRYPFQFLNFGNPRMMISPRLLELYYQSSGIFEIKNYEGGILIWEIIDKPAWLTISKQHGIIEPGDSERLTLIISRDKLAKGDYTGEINIAVNSIEKNMKVKVTMKVFNTTLSGTVGTIEGEVIDAEYCKANGLMVIASKNPNRIYFIKSGQPLKSLNLDDTPVCVTLSENGDLAAAALTNTDLSLINPETLTITKNIKTGIIASDLVLNGNSWAYLSPKPVNFTNLLSINLNSGEIIKNPLDMNGLSLLKKVPGKNLLYGSKVGWSPDFLVVFDISQGAANNIADQWRIYLSRFWFSENGQYIISGLRKIYEAPGYLQKGNISESPVVAGLIAVLPGTINAMDHSEALNELFIVYKNPDYRIGTSVLRIDDPGYTTKDAFTVNNCIVNENGNLLSLSPEVPYLFVNKTGSELNLIKKGMYMGKSYWFYETISLP